MVAEFNASNEWGIEVVAEFAGGYGDIYDKMINAIAADDPTLMPNLTVGYANQVAKYQLVGRAGGHGLLRGQPQVGADGRRGGGLSRRASLRPT